MKSFRSVGLVPFFVFPLISIYSVSVAQGSGTECTDALVLGKSEFRSKDSVALFIEAGFLKDPKIKSKIVSFSQAIPRDRNDLEAFGSADNARVGSRTNEYLLSKLFDEVFEISLDQFDVPRIFGTVPGRKLLQPASDSSLIVEYFKERHPLAATIGYASENLQLTEAEYWLKKRRFLYYLINSPIERFRIQRYFIRHFSKIEAVAKSVGNISSPIAGTYLKSSYKGDVVGQKTFGSIRKMDDLMIFLDQLKKYDSAVDWVKQDLGSRVEFQNYLNTPTWIDSSEGEAGERVNIETLEDLKKVVNSIEDWNQVVGQAYNNVDKLLRYGYSFDLQNGSLRSIVEEYHFGRIVDQDTLLTAKMWVGFERSLAEAAIAVLDKLKPNFKYSRYNNELLHSERRVAFEHDFSALSGLSGQKIESMLLSLNNEKSVFKFQQDQVDGLAERLHEKVRKLSLKEQLLTDLALSPNSGLEFEKWDWEVLL